MYGWCYPCPFSFPQGLFYTPKHNQEEFEALPRGSYRTIPVEGGGRIFEIGPASDELVVRVTVDAGGVVQRIQAVPISGGAESKQGDKEEAPQSISDLFDVQGSSRVGTDVRGDWGHRKPPAGGQGPNDVEAHVIYPAKHHVVGQGEMANVMSAIKEEMEERCSQLGLDGKLLEAERLRQRTENDLLLLDAVGTCKVDVRTVLCCRAFTSGDPTLVTEVVLTFGRCTTTSRRKPARHVSSILLSSNLINPPLSKNASEKRSSLTRQLLLLPLSFCRLRVSRTTLATSVDAAPETLQRPWWTISRRMTGFW